jgi:hypothetical protein
MQGVMLRLQREKTWAPTANAAELFRSNVCLLAGDTMVEYRL